MNIQQSGSPTCSGPEAKTCLIVTGAAGWLGSAVIEASKSRAKIQHVIAVCRKDIGPFSGEYLTTLHGVDLATEAGIGVLRSATEKHATGRIALIHCAGAFPPPTPLHMLRINELNISFSSNVVSFIGAVHSVVPTMRHLQFGRIVAFSSHTQKDAYPFFGGFNIAKAALESAVKTVANENARFGIVANTISVATLQTETERTLKPLGRYSDWVPTDSLSSFTLDLVLCKNAGLNGSRLHYWLHSDTFFGSSVFERNPIDPEELDPCGTEKP